MAAVKAFKRTHVNLSVKPALRFRLLVVRPMLPVGGGGALLVSRGAAFQIITKLHNYRARRLHISQIKTVFLDKFAVSRLCRLQAVPQYQDVLPA